MALPLQAWQCIEWLHLPIQIKVNHIAIVAATAMEIQPLLSYLEDNAVKLRPNVFRWNDQEIEILLTGIGILNSTYSMMDYLSKDAPVAWYQLGIGGALDVSLEIGGVYVIKSELLYGFGAEDTDGHVIDQFQLEWAMPDVFPYHNGVLPCRYIPSTLSIPTVSGMTVMHAHGDPRKISLIRKGLHGQIESMEGAAFFYTSLMKKIPFLCLRSVSNYVEKRDKKKWEIKKAIDNVNQLFIDLFIAGQLKV